MSLHEESAATFTVTMVGANAWDNGVAQRQLDMVNAELAEQGKPTYASYEAYLADVVQSAHHSYGDSLGAADYSSAFENATASGRQQSYDVLMANQKTPE